MIPSAESVPEVVDVQNDYCHDKGFFGRAGHDLCPIQVAVERILALVRAEQAAGPTRPDGSLAAPAPARRSAPLAAGARDFSRGQPAPGECVVVKHRYSAFVGGAFEVVLRALGRPVLLPAGVTTNVCMGSTARDAFIRDWQVALVEDRAAAKTTGEHEAAVHNMRTSFGRVVDAARLARAWADSPAR